MKVVRTEPTLCTSPTVSPAAGESVCTAGPLAMSDVTTVTSTSPIAGAAKAVRPSLEQLLKDGKFSAIVDTIDEAMMALAEIDVAELSIGELIDRTTALYLMQHQLIGTANAISTVEDRVTAMRALELIQKVGDLQTATFEQTVALADAKEKAPVKAIELFRNTKKQPGFHAPDELQAYFRTKLADFIQKGGDVTQIKRLSGETLSRMKSGAVYEFAIDSQDVPRVGPGGHALLLWGDIEGLAGGTMRVFKNAENKVTQVILGTFSGHLRNGTGPLVHLARHLIACGVPAEVISFQGGEAGSPRALELLYRAVGKDGAEAQREMARIETPASPWNPDVLAEQPDNKCQRPPAAAVDPSVARLQLVVFTMQQVAKAVMADGVILEALDEASNLAAAIREVLVLSERAGDMQAYEGAMALLVHVSNLKLPQIDAAGEAIFAKMIAEWGNHAFGVGSKDPVEIFGPAPVGERRARICATLDIKVTEANIQKMLLAGMNIARFNTAHATVDELKTAMARVRKVAAEVGRPILTQVDLSGPKIRLGKFANPDKKEQNDIWLKDREEVVLTTRDVLGDAKLLPIDFPSLGKDVEVGHRIFLNDGLVQLEVMKKTIAKDGTAEIACVVKVGGKVWDRKGVNLPDSKLSVAALTDEDKHYLTGLLPDLDLVALSFVSDEQDIFDARAVMQKAGKMLPIIAKIERREAIQNLQQIAVAADALMVARGDLGVEIGYESVPAAERKISAVGNAFGKAVMVATEVLLSMTKSSRPSRGEVEGLYSAILTQGAEAVMLGKETSFADKPDETVKAAARIILRAERDLLREILRGSTKFEAGEATPKNKRFTPLGMNVTQTKGA